MDIIAIQYQSGLMDALQVMLHLYNQYYLWQHIILWIDAMMMSVKPYDMLMALQTLVHLAMIIALQTVAMQSSTTMKLGR